MKAMRHVGVTRWGFCEGVSRCPASIHHVQKLTIGRKRNGGRGKGEREKESKRKQL